MGHNESSQAAVMTMLLLLASQFGPGRVGGEMTTPTCLNYYNNICNINCATSPSNCYIATHNYLCPCMVKCYQDHCMTGLIAQTCAGCALHGDFCRPWHDHIELHTCGNKRMDTRAAFRAHCVSWSNCVNQCPPAGLCYDDSAQPNYNYWDIYADQAKVAEVLGTG